jgi:hypothetical protein
MFVLIGVHSFHLRLDLLRSKNRCDSSYPLQRSRPTRQLKRPYPISYKDQTSSQELRIMKFHEYERSNHPWIIGR